MPEKTFVIELLCYCANNQKEIDGPQADNDTRQMIKNPQIPVAVKEGRFYNQVFEGDLQNRQFFDCDFTASDFSRCDLSGSNFINCRFSGCNLSSPILEGAGFMDVEFAKCQLSHSDFSICNQHMLSFQFRICNLDKARFKNTRLTNTVFDQSSLRGADFRGCALDSVSFCESNLLDCQFEGSIIANVDFSQAEHIELDLDANYLTNVKFAYSSLPLLQRKNQLGFYRIVLVETSSNGN